VHYVPLARVCVTTTFNGVPFGAQIAWLSCSSTGMLLARTRVAAVIHWPVTHGIGLPGGTVNGQPAIVYGADWVTIGCPLTFTRGLVTVG